MNNRRLTNAILLALLVFNIGFIGSWWYGHMKMHRNMHEGYDHFSGHESKGAMYLVKELGFDQTQQTQLEALRKEHFSRIAILESSVARNEKKVMAAIASNPMDSAHINQFADSIGILKASIQKELFGHFSSIKKLCTPAQSKKFDALIAEMAKEFPHHWEMHNSGNEIKHDSN